MSKTELSTLEIRELIPHRYPMLLVDRIVDIQEKESCTGIKNVTINEEFFQGHFPNEPIMPGVLIVEALAQTAGALVVETAMENTENVSVYFMSVESARFRRPVRPGDQMKMLVKRLQSRHNVWKFSGKAMVDAQVCAEATFTAMIVDKTKQR